MGNRIKHMTKKECISVFMRLVRKNNIFKKFYSEDEIVKMLNSNISDVENVDNLPNKMIAVYNIWNKKIEYLTSLDDKKIVKSLIHEMVHALFRHWGPDKKTIYSGALRYDFSVEVDEKEGISKKFISAVSNRGINEGITEVIIAKLFKNIGKKYFDENNGDIWIDDSCSSIKRKSVYSLQVNAVEQLEAILGFDFILEYAIKGELDKDEFSKYFETDDYKLSEKDKKRIFVRFKEIVSHIEEYHFEREGPEVILDISSIILNEFLPLKVKQAQKSKDYYLAIELLDNMKKYKDVFPEVFFNHRRYKELNVDYKVKIADSKLAWKIFRCKAKEFFGKKKKEVKDDFCEKDSSLVTPVQDDEWRKKLGIVRIYTPKDMKMAIDKDKKRIKRIDRFLGNDR